MENRKYHIGEPPTEPRRKIKRTRVYYGLTLPQWTRYGHDKAVTWGSARETEKLTIMLLDEGDAKCLEKFGTQAHCMQPPYGEAWKILHDIETECGGTARFIRAEIMPTEKSWYDTRKPATDILPEWDSMPDISEWSRFIKI